MNSCSSSDGKGVCVCVDNVQKHCYDLFQQHFNCSILVCVIIIYFPTSILLVITVHMKTALDEDSVSKSLVFLVVLYVSSYR